MGCNCFSPKSEKSQTVLEQKKRVQEAVNPVASVIPDALIDSAVSVSFVTKAAPAPKASSVDSIFKSFSHSRAGSSSKGKEVIFVPIQGTAQSIRLPEVKPQNSTTKQNPPRANPRPQNEHWARVANLQTWHPSRPGNPLAVASKTWAKLFPIQSRRPPTTLLEYVELGSHKGRKFVEYDDGDLKEMDSHRALSLVGYVIESGTLKEILKSSFMREAFLLPSSPMKRICSMQWREAPGSWQVVR
ncbi:hypothetical protein QJS10_CPA02g01115 [Acorus calamus]|uniref:Uncharacterized protein n=1 Tax=Acorus calamus TaxID=4465 RepID=A0AAV9FFJ6_ACOCL|nr:hypothetical protein QJS10_CPA02g01115 [Acorus calamus]